MTIRRLVRGGSLFIGLASLDLVGRVGAQLTLVLLARVLGPEEFGAYAVVFVSISIVLTALDAGLGESGTAKHTSTQLASINFLQSHGALRMRIALLATPVIAVAGLSAGPQLGLSWWAVIILSSTMPPYVAVTNRAYALRTAERLALATLLLSILALGHNAGALVTAYVRPDLETALTGLSVGIWATALALGKWPRLNLTWEQCHRLLAGGIPILVTALSTVIYTRADRILLALFEGSKEAGVYAAAYTLVLGFSLVGGVITTFVMPRAIKRYREPDETDGQGYLVFAGLGMLAILGLTLAALLASFRVQIVELFFGIDFISAAPLLAILSLSVPLYLCNPFLATVLIATNRAKVVAQVAVANLAVAIMAFPISAKIWGAEGMAWVSVAIEGIGLILMGLLLARPVPKLASDP